MTEKRWQQITDLFTCELEVDQGERKNEVYDCCIANLSVLQKNPVSKSKNLIRVKQ